MEGEPDEGQSPRLYLTEDLEQAEALQLACGEVVAFSTRCPGKETPNEDAAAVIPCGPDAAVLLVADGMGGMSAGEQAAAHAVHEVVAALQAISDDPGQLRTAILDGIDRANQAVQQLGVGAGTTLAVVEIHENRIRPYHVGDSMILAVGQRGKLKLQTIPHSPVGYGVHAGLLDEYEAMLHTERHLVSNFVGQPEMRIEIGPSIELARLDTVLLASDGLADNLRADEVVQLVRKGRLVSGVQALVEQARGRMLRPEPERPSKPDDLTVLAYRPPRPPRPLAASVRRGREKA